MVLGLLTARGKIVVKQDWANIGPTSGRQCRRWADVGPTYITIYDNMMTSHKESLLQIFDVNFRLLCYSSC